MIIVWDDDAKIRLKDVIFYGVDNWGLKIARQFHENIIKTEKRLVMNPKMGHPEPLLLDKLFEYRSIIVQKNFKLVYRIDSEKEVLFIVDLWDTRREPTALMKGIR